MILGDSRDAGTRVVLNWREKTMLASHNVKQVTLG
jgi:hypothetical protein